MLHSEKTINLTRTRNLSDIKRPNDRPGRLSIRLNVDPGIISSDVDPDLLNADPDPQNLMNADPG